KGGDEIARRCLTTGVSFRAYPSVHRCVTRQAVERTNRISKQGAEREAGGCALGYPTFERRSHVNATGAMYRRTTHNRGNAHGECATEQGHCRTLVHELLGGQV